MAGISLVIKLEEEEKGNLFDILKGDGKEMRILKALEDALNEKGPVERYGVGSGERRISFDFKVSVSELQEI